MPMYGAEEAYPNQFYRGGSSQTTDLLNQGLQTQMGILQNTGAEEAANIRAGGEALGKAFPQAVQMYQQGQQHSQNMDLGTQQGTLNQQRISQGQLDLGAAQRKNAFMSGNGGTEEGAGNPNFVGPPAAASQPRPMSPEQKLWAADVEEAGHRTRQGTLDEQSSQQALQRGAALMPGEVRAQTAGINSQNASTDLSRAQVTNIGYQNAMSNATTAYQGAKSPAEVAALDQQFSRQGLKPQDIATAKTKAGIEQAGRTASSNLIQQSAPQAQYDQQILGDASAKISALTELGRSTQQFSGTMPFTPNESQAQKDVGAALHVIDPSAEQRFNQGWSPANPKTTQSKVAMEALARGKAAIEADLARVEQSARATGNQQQLQQVQALKLQLQQVNSVTGQTGHNSMSLRGGTVNAGSANGMFLTGSGQGNTASQPPPPAQGAQAINFQGKQPQGLGALPPTLRRGQ